MRLPPVLYSQQARTVNILPVTCYVIFVENLFLKGLFKKTPPEGRILSVAARGTT